VYVVYTAKREEIRSERNERVKASSRTAAEKSSRQ
jgi:hypothetical protein